MSYTNHRSFKLRMTAASGTDALVTLIAGCSSSSSSGESDVGGSSAPSFSAPANSSAAASSPATNQNSDFTCGNSGTTPVIFSFPNNSVAPGLTACTNSDQSETMIVNSSSSSIVWLVTEPNMSNPTFNQDVSDRLPLASLYFRSYLLDYSMNYSTIEPGIQQLIPQSPSNVRIEEAPGLQSAWAVSTLLAKGTVSGVDKAASALEDHGSVLSKAIFTCISAGYNFGQQLQNNGQAQQLSAEEIQSDLSSYVGLWNSTSDCGEKMEAANEASESGAEAPDLSPRRVEIEAPEDPVWRDVGSDVEDDIAHGLEKVAGHIHD